MSEEPLRVVIGEDHPAVRENLRVLLALEPGLAVVGAAPDGGRVLALIRALRPDVAVLDERMPGATGSQVAAALAREHAPTRVVLYTADADVCRRPRSPEIAECINKDARFADLVAAIWRADSSHRVA